MNEQKEDRSPHANPGAPTPQRLLALLAVAIVFVLYRPGAEPTLLNTLVLPLTGLLATWYLTHSIAVIAFGSLLLAGAHAQPGADELLQGWVYPVIALGAGMLFAIILLRRFRAAMARRRIERTARSTSRDPADS
ncbi:MAG: hypothetical protein MK142_11770 [Pseudomonadales bacterium]|nr:hypothetical protein [Pseudomonadales bacterium]